MSDVNSSGIAATLRLYTDIALFRRGPEDVPVSAVLLVLTVGAYMLMSLLLSSVTPGADEYRLGMIALDSFFAIFWYWVVMRLARRPERFLQTMTAIFGYQTVLAPAFVTGAWLFMQNTTNTAIQIPVLLLLVALSVWTLAVNGRILKSATGWPQFSCLGIVILQAVVSRLLILGLFAGPAGSS